MSDTKQSPEALNTAVIDLRNELVGLYNLGRAGLLPGWAPIWGRDDGLHLLRSAPDSSTDLPDDEVVIDLGHGPDAPATLSEFGRRHTLSGFKELIRTYTINLDGPTVTSRFVECNYQKSLLGSKLESRKEITEEVPAERFGHIKSNIIEIKEAPLPKVTNRKKRTIGHAATN